MGTEVVVPHSNHTDIVLPPGLTIPRNSAELDVTALASLVATLGAEVLVISDVVVKLRTSPGAVPPKPYPTARK